jgi:N-acetylmuramoyl-L-alanine amidase
MAKYNIHAGHNAAGKAACGAVGLLNESTEARRVKQYLLKYLRAAGNTVYDCTVNNASGVSANLIQIVDKCNKHSVTLDISVHFNSGAKDKKGNGKTTGFECYVTENTGIKKEVGNRACKAMAQLGFTNRGVKVSNNLYVLNKTYSKAILFEICFVDDKDDYELYKKVGYKRIARVLAEAIVGDSITLEYKALSTMNIRKSKSILSTKVGSIPKGSVVKGELIGSWLKIPQGYVKFYGEQKEYFEEV